MKAASISLSVLAFRRLMCVPRARAASCTSRASADAVGNLGLISIAMAVLLGTSCRASSNRFGPISAAIMVVPVRLPPGRLRLATSPVSTGSPPRVKTIGMVLVAALAASGDGSPPVAATLNPHVGLSDTVSRRDDGAQVFPRADAVIASDYSRAFQSFSLPVARERGIISSGPRTLVFGGRALYRPFGIAGARHEFPL